MPVQSPVIELSWPVAGLVRNVGFQHQSPYSTPYCFNARPFDPLATRQRGGSRPAISKAYAEQLGGGLPFQLLGSAGYIGSDGVSRNVLVAVSDGKFYQNASNPGHWTQTAGSLNPDAPQLQGTQVGPLYYIADYRTPNVTGLDGAISGTNQLSDHSGVITDWRTLNIDLANDVVWISGLVDLESNIFPITSVAADGSYITFTGAMTDQASGATWQIGRVPKVFDPANPTAALTPLMGSFPIPAAHYNVGLVTIAAGVVTLTGGSWAAVPQASSDSMLTLTIPNVSGIGTSQYLVAVGTLGTTTLTLDDTTTDADRTNVSYTLSWTSLYYGIPPLNCPLCCTYRGRLVLAGQPGPIWYMSRVLDPNDWDYGYDPNDASRAVAGNATTAGGIPDNLTALIPHSDDYLIFGCERSMWLLTADPAYGGTITALSREIGVLGPNAWCRLPDSSLVVLSRDGLYQVAPGGQSYPQPLSRPTLPQELLQVDRLNNTVTLCYDTEARGIHISVTPLAATVTTIASTGTFTAPVTGWYSVEARGPGSGGQDNTLPLFLVAGQVITCTMGAIPVTTTVTDASGNVLLQATAGMWASPVSQVVITATGTHYFVDWVGSSFWPQVFPVAMQATAMIRYSPGPATPVITILGDLDGYARTFDLAATSDDGVAFMAEVVYGPVRIGGPGYEGVLMSLAADLDSVSTAATYRLFVGDTAQQIVAAIPSLVSVSGGTWPAGFNHRSYPHCRGGAIGILVSAGTGWAMEAIRVQTRKGGPLR